MAKTQQKGGQYRKMLLEQRGEHVTEEPEGVSFFRIRFYLCLCLFVAYMILDYTKASVYTLDSSRIYAEIQKDLTAEFSLEDAWSEVFHSITKEIYIQ